LGDRKFRRVATVGITLGRLGLEVDVREALEARYIDSIQKFQAREDFEGGSARVTRYLFK